MLTHSFSFRIRYAETDQMGVVHHGNYAQFFELGRTEWLRNLGVTYKDMEKTGILLPVISLSCNFKQSAYYDELLTVKTILVKQPAVKIEFDYEISNEQNEILTTGNTILAFINASTKRPMRCPDYILKKLNFPTNN